MLEGQCSVVKKKGPTSTRLIVIKQPYSKKAPWIKAQTPLLGGCAWTWAERNVLDSQGSCVCVCVCVCVCGCMWLWGCLSVWVHECAVKLCMNRWIDPRLATFYRTLSVRKQNLIFHAAADVHCSIIDLHIWYSHERWSLWKKKTSVQKMMHTLPCSSSDCICVYHDRRFLCLLTTLCLCVACVVRKKARPFPSEKMPGKGHKSPRLPVGRHGKRRPQRQAGLQLRGETQTSIVESTENVLWVLLDA